MDESRMEKIAFTIGRNLAKYVNSHPSEAQNWDYLDESDDIPNEDYRLIRRVCGRDTSRHMDQAYRDGFNSEFKQEK